MSSLIALMMEAVRTSETSVYSNETTARYIPEGSNLQVPGTYSWRANSLNTGDQMWSSRRIQHDSC
jgi:predicted secreted protein